MKGIGEKNFAKIEPWLTVGDAPKAARQVSVAGGPPGARQLRPRRAAHSPLGGPHAPARLLTRRDDRRRRDRARRWPAVAAPVFRALFADAHILGAGQQFRVALSSRLVDRRPHRRLHRRSASSAGTTGASSTPSTPTETPTACCSADIASGEDRRIAGPYPLSGGAPGVRVGINPGVPNLPPEHGRAVGRPRPLRRVRHPVVLAARDRDARHVLPGGRLGPGRGARQRRHRPRAPDAVARRALAGAVRDSFRLKQTIRPKQANDLQRAPEAAW